MARIIFVVALLAAAGAAGPAARAGGWSDRVADPVPAEKLIERWSFRARAAARLTMARYGMPDEVRAESLIWRANGPWKRTVVHRDAWRRYAFWADRYHVENALAYDVPARCLADLARFDDRLIAEPGRGELAARSGSETENYLLLNVADEIVNGKRTVADARAFSARILRLADSGKSSPYLTGLLFAADGDAVSRASPSP
jgi:hypothetical protein